MPIEGLNIFSVGGFTFFLLILSIGYFVIEIVFYKFDFIRAIFKRYNNNLFDRIITYILVGIITNLIFLFYFVLSKSAKPLIDFFNITGKTAESFSTFGKDIVTGFQMITFSLFYFTILITFLIVFGLFFHAIRYFIIESKKTFTKKSSKK